jgi:hypothetical protein
VCPSTTHIRNDEMVQDFLNITEENSLQLWTEVLDIVHTRRKIKPTMKLAWVYEDDAIVTVEAVYRQNVNCVQPVLFSWATTNARYSQLLSFNK